MADSRFTPQNKTTHDRLSTNTVGLVELSDFRKRRAEVLDQQDREARQAALGSTDIGSDSTPTSGAERDNGPVTKKKKKSKGKKLLSFDDDEPAEEDGEAQAKTKVKANASVRAVTAMTKADLRKEAAEREALRREFILVQDAVKATEIAIPFVFHDGANTPGGTVRVKKGDYIWLFLDKSRKVGAQVGAGDKTNSGRRSWARVGVDDLMLVRGSVIIPHHYDFYYFIINKSVGPGGKRLFDFSADAAKVDGPSDPLSFAPDIDTLEGAEDDPLVTKVVDRRWYQKNKHIFPASTWQDFDAEKDYAAEVRKDTGGNTFFFSG